MMSKRLRMAGSLLAAVLAAGCTSDVPTRTAVPDDASTSTFVNTHIVIGPGGALLGVNSSGLMVGSHPVAGAPRAFAYSTATGPVTLTTLAAGTKVLPPRDTAYAVNRSGVIVGTSNNAAGTSRPVRWLNASAAPQDLGTPGSGGALDINNDGMIVGWWSNPGSTFVRALVLTSTGSFIDPLVGNSGKAWGVNDDGVVVGEIELGGGVSRAFRWTAADGMQILGTLGGTSSVAYDVAPSGRIVGASTTSTGETHAFIWYPEFDRMDDLGTLGGTESVALATNGVVVVGYSTTTPGGPRHAFAWRTRTRTIRDQGTDGGVHATMRAVNQYNLAVGSALDSASASSRVYWQLTEVNTNPTVYFTATPATINEGQFVSFSYNAFDDEDELTYRWDFGNGTGYVPFSFTPPPTSRAYHDNGTYPVSVIVADPSGETDTATTTVTVLNIAPTGTFRTPPLPLPEGSTFSISVVGVTDAQIDRSAGIQASFNCGNGVWLAYSTTHAQSCTAPGTPGTITVGVRLRDKDFAVTEYTRNLTVINAPPAVTLTPVSSTTITLGETFTAQGMFTDGGTGDGPYSFRFTWGDTRRTDGVLNAPGPIPPVQHRYLTTGTFQVRLSVTDVDGTGQSSIVNVTVNP
jgi:probable HAF family extracellular repeat protein